jgi:hypothetical protein
MAYQINKTDGSILTTVADGQIDTLSTDLTLIGKNYSGFGEALNENLVKLLENFAATSQPEKPIRGQIWFDSSELKLKVYTGTSFAPVSSANISSTQPTTLGAGDLWFNDVDRQLYFFDGSETILLGPIYSESQGLSGFRVISILDTLNQTRVVTQLWTNGILLGIFSKDRFQIKQAIDGYGEAGKFVIPGFNKGNYELRVTNATTGALETFPIKFDVTVTNSEQLGAAPATTYVRKDSANSVSGQFRVEVDAGILVGAGNQIELSVNTSSGDAYLYNTASNKSLYFSVRKDNDQESAVKIEPVNRVISLYEGFASSQVLVGGNLVVTGDLTIEGTTTTVNTSSLTIEDKNIQLALQTGVAPTDENASGGGIILEGASKHVLLWSQTSEVATVDLPALLSSAWNSSDHFNLAQNKYYAIDGVPVLEQISTTPGDKRFRLTTAVTEIAGVSSFGKQIIINVGPGGLLDPAFMTLEDNKISTTAAAPDLELEPFGTGNVVLLGSPKITGLADPTAAQDAATKEYVDDVIETRSIVLAMDLSDGKPNSYITTNILPAIAPVSEYRNGTIARILCTIINNSATTLPINPLISLSTATFNTPSGTAPAVTNVAISNATVPGAAVSTTRIVKEFQLILGVWTFISDTILPP